MENKPKGQVFVIHGDPMGKPRQSRSDKWKKRDCVVRYRSWADSAREQAPRNLIKDPVEVNWTAYLPMPKSWSKKKKLEMAGKPHRTKPDRDNIDKALLDALWSEDQGIAKGAIEKRWDDGCGPRLIVEVYSQSQRKEAACG